MPPLLQMRRKRLAVIWPLALACLAFALSRLSISEEFERRLLDLRFRVRGPRSVSHSPFQIVAIDDQSFSALQEKWPFRTSRYARAIENLNRAGARWIVFDLEFTEPHPLFPQDDSLFAQAIQRAGNVILIGKVAYTHFDHSAAPYAFSLPPLPVLRQTGAPWGIVNELTDADDFTRRYLLGLPIGNAWLPSIGMEILRAWFQLPPSTRPIMKADYCEFGSLRIPLFDRQSFLINYYGPAGVFPAISLSSVLDDSSFNLAPGLDSDYMESILGGGVTANPFKNKIVLIGASAEELHDSKNTPFYAFAPTPRKMAGVEMHAHALQTVLDRAFISRSSPFLVWALNLGLALMIFFAVGLRQPSRGFALSLAAISLPIAAAFFLFSRWNYWLDLFPLLLCGLLVYIGASLYYYALERRRRAGIQEMFAHYVPNEVVTELVNNPQMLKLGGEKRRLTILFADIWDFASLSERMPAQQLVEHLNDYMTAMTDIILAHSGVIDKYEGDLIMAEFGAPVFYPDHAQAACRAALKMQEGLRSLRRKWAAAGRPELAVRIGINTGDVIVGNMGSRDVFDYTVLGDAVNLCSRLEKANKFYGTDILISQATQGDLPVHFITRTLDNLLVKGRREPVRVLELLSEGGPALPEDQRQMLRHFEAGWSCYQTRNWTQAQLAFAEALRCFPADRPSQILLERCRQFEINPPEPQWNGATAIKLP